VGQERGWRRLARRTRCKEQLIVGGWHQATRKVGSSGPICATDSIHRTVLVADASAKPARRASSSAILCSSAARWAGAHAVCRLASALVRACSRRVRSSFTGLCSTPPPNVADLDLRPEVASAGLLGVGGGALGRRYTHEVGVRRHMGFHDRLGLRESSRIAGAIGRVGVDERFLARWR